MSIVPSDHVCYVILVMSKEDSGAIDFNRAFVCRRAPWCGNGRAVAYPSGMSTGVGELFTTIVAFEVTVQGANRCDATAMDYRIVFHILSILYSIGDTRACD